jgi:putative membrane protein
MKALLFTLPLALFIACNSGNSQKQARKDSSEAMKESMDHIDQSTVKFVTEVANGNLNEIALGKMAEKNAKYDRIKAFAGKMIAAHTQAMDLLQKASYASGVTVPVSSSDTAQYANLAGKKGPKFDRDYINEMINAHQKMSDMLDAARKNLKDTSLQRYATQMLPEVKGHLEEARNLLEYVRKQFDFRPEQGLDYSH